MKRFLISALSALLLVLTISTSVPSTAYAATWATGNTATSVVSIGTSPYTISYNNGTGDLLIVNIGINNPLQIVTSVTYNGVAMTEASFLGVSATSIDVFWMIAPASGTNNLVITTSVSFTGTVVISSFTGAAQTGQPDSSAVTSSGSGSTRSVTVTTATNNALVIGAFGDNNGTMGTVGSGMQEIVRSANNEWLIDASNPLAKTPAGSQTVLHNQNNAGAFTGVVGLSFKLSTGPASYNDSSGWWSFFEW